MGSRLWWMVDGLCAGVCELVVRTSSGSYPVNVGCGILGDVAAEVSVLVVDERVEVAGVAAGTPLLAVNAGEPLKTLAGCEDLIVGMREAGLRRGDVVGAVGGGSVQDAVTLAASLYMRGIPWVYCPSTAMAALDSCIGGKSSINVGPFKNLAGNIYPPRRVIVDTALLASLDASAIACGLAEAAKICFAASPEAFDAYLELAPAVQPDGIGEISTDLVHHVLARKQWFVEVDEFDKAERQLLNFGHTFGHALESATGFSVPHGLAVAYGVIAACSHPAAVSGPGTQALVAHCAGVLSASRIDASGVRDRVDWPIFRSAVSSDKKATRDGLRLVLPVAQGSVSVVEVPRGERSLAEIQTAMEEALWAV